MRWQFIIPIAILIALLCFGSGIFAVPPEAIDSDNDKPLVRSEPVSLGNGDYHLVTRDGSTLVLEHEVRGKVSRVTLKLHEEKPVPGLPKESWADGEIRAIALSRWSRTSLVAVVKLKLKDDYTFWCVTIGRVEEKLVTQNTLSVPAAVISKGTKEDRVLALSGSRSLYSITAVIGKNSDTTIGGIDSGTIFFNGCPTLGAWAGRVDRFKVTPSPEKANGLDKNGK